MFLRLESDTIVSAVFHDIKFPAMFITKFLDISCSLHTWNSNNCEARSLFDSVGEIQYHFRIISVIDIINIIQL